MEVPVPPISIGHKSNRWLGESISDVETVLNKFDIKLRSTAGEFRNIESVIDEVASRWKDFTSVEQAQIATAMAGECAPEHIEIYGVIYDIA